MHVLKARLSKCAVVVLGASMLLGGCEPVNDSVAETEGSVRNPNGGTVTFWNVTGINAYLATPLGPRGAALGARAMAMMHVAMADAVFSIHPVYKAYAVRLKGHGQADEIAAASAAAYGVLIRLFPAQQPALDAALAQVLAQVPDGHKKDEGLALGDEVAAAVVALKANDGSTGAADYTPPVGLGYWVPDPRTGASPFLSVASWVPWTLQTNSQFRPGSPPDIYGSLFATDLAEVKAIGGTISSVRTLGQECIARFSTDNPVAQYHRLARAVAAAVPDSLETNVRTFALFSVTLADAFIASFDAKFTYHFWRPWTAIQNAGAIGHAELQDSTFTSLLPNPPHQEYPANHAVQGSSVTAILRYIYGDDIPAVTWTCSGAGCRADICPAAYTSGHLDDFREIIGLARLYGGIHYRNSLKVGWAMGAQVAQNALGTTYLPNEVEVEE